jgi:LacI family transcriptional regulator
METRGNFGRAGGNGTETTRRPRVAILLRTGEYWHRMIFRGIVDYVTTHEPWLVFLEGMGDIAGNITTLRQLQIDALIMGNSPASPYPLARRRARLLRKLHVPTVLALSTPMDTGLIEIVPDDPAIGKMAADHLLTEGFRSFGFYGGDYPYSWTRKDAFVETLRAAGHKCAVHMRANIPWGKLHREWTVGPLAKWLSELPHPAGVMACSDLWARHVVHVCDRIGLRMPEDIALIGVDNDKTLCEILTPTLSSIPLNPRQLGYQAAEVLSRRMKGEGPGEGVMRVPPLPLVMRRSSNLVTADADIANAARFIRENAGTSICVQDILDHVCISRRKLELGFKRNFNRTPQQEIWRMHVERAKVLLQQTTMKMSRIAEQSGFASASHMSVVFHKETGMPPRTWRNRFHITE